MGTLITLLALLDFIAFGICFVRYVKEETVKSIIGWIITSAIMCILHIACIITDGTFITKYYTNLCIYIILFVMAVYEMIKKKKNK